MPPKINKIIRPTDAIIEYIKFANLKEIHLLFRYRGRHYYGKRGAKRQIDGFALKPNKYGEDIVNLEIPLPYNMDIQPNTHCYFPTLEKMDRTNSGGFYQPEAKICKNINETHITDTFYRIVSAINKRKIPLLVWIKLAYNLQNFQYDTRRNIEQNKYWSCFIQHFICKLFENIPPVHFREIELETFYMQLPLYFHNAISVTDYKHKFEYVNDPLYPKYPLIYDIYATKDLRLVQKTYANQIISNLLQKTIDTVEITCYIGWELIRMYINNFIIHQIYVTCSCVVNGYRISNISSIANTLIVLLTDVLAMKPKLIKDIGKYELLQTTYDDIIDDALAETGKRERFFSLFSNNFTCDVEFDIIDPLPKSTYQILKIYDDLTFHNSEQSYNNIIQFKVRVFCQIIKTGILIPSPYSAKHYHIFNRVIAKCIKHLPDIDLGEFKKLETLVVKTKLFEQRQTDIKNMLLEEFTHEKIENLLIEWCDLCGSFHTNDQKKCPMTFLKFVCMHPLYDPRLWLHITSFVHIFVPEEPSKSNVITKIKYEAKITEIYFAANNLIVRNIGYNKE